MSAERPKVFLGGERGFVLSRVAVLPAIGLCQRPDDARQQEPLQTQSQPKRQKQGGSDRCRRPNGSHTSLYRTGNRLLPLQVLPTLLRENR